MQESRSMHFNGTHEGRSFRTACRPEGMKRDGKFAMYYVTDEFTAVDCSDCRAEVERERMDRINAITDEALRIYEILLTQRTAAPEEVEVAA